MSHLFSLLAFLAISSVYGVTRITTSDFKAVNFAKEIKGWNLTGSAIREVEVDKEGICRLECVEENRCLSYNFGPTANKRFKCQLNHSDRFASLVNFVEDDKVLYRGIQSVCERDSSVCGDKEVCIPSYHDDTAKCDCIDGYSGKPCKPTCKSCAQLLKDGFTVSGVYTINPDGDKPMQVLCDMTTGDGGWTVFQTRLNGSVDFYRDWQSYKDGFGDLMGEFWLGNENLHRLTAADNVKLRVDLEDFEGDIGYAEYTTFKVADEEDNYRLLVGGYSGTAGDSMTITSGKQFTTNDKDNDDHGANCAIAFKGAWWYMKCHVANLNGIYYVEPVADPQSVCWKSFGRVVSLKRTEMKLKPRIQN